MTSNTKMKSGRFLELETLPIDPKALLKIKGSIAGKDVTIAISPAEEKNYINPKIANQLVIPESNIIEKLDIFDKKKYDIKNLQLNIGDYTFISQFTMKTLVLDNSDIVLGSPWMETLGSVILNTKKKFLTFTYKKKKITLQDVNLKPNSVTPEDVQEISQVISQEGKKVIQNMQKEIDKITTNKNEEVARLKDHNDKLLTQIKKLKKDKKSLENKVQQLVENKASNVEIRVEEKETGTNAVNVITQEEDKQVAKDANLDVVVPAMNISSESYVASSITSSPKENQNITTQLRMESQTKKVPYRHPNHGSRQLDQAMSSEQKQVDIPKNTNISAISSSDNSAQVSNRREIPQKIDLGWSDPFSVRQFCLSLRGSYQLVSTRMTAPRREDVRNRKRNRGLSSTSFEDKAF